MRGHYGQTKWAATNQLSGRGIVVWIRSFIEPDLFDNKSNKYRNSVDKCIHLASCQRNVFSANWFVSEMYCNLNNLQ